MIKAKTGNWFIENPQRGRSNNSVALLKSDTTKEEFDKIMESVKHSGEPGFLWFDDLDFMFNPCVEVGMLPLTSDGRSGFQVCNLVEINGAKSINKEVFLKQCKVASIMGTLQAGYTNFDFLKDATREIVEEEALIGVGITGMMNNPDVLFNEEILREGARVVKKWNKIVADKIGINQAARTTVIKPSGNASVLLGCASGIHGEHSNKYFRHVQFNKETEVAKLFIKNNPEMCETSVWNKDNDIVVAFPVDDFSKSIYKRDLLGVKQLEYVKLVQNSWILDGKNQELCKREKLTHNVSNTITVDDWDKVGDFIYDNREYLCGVSLLASVGDSAYPQAPFAEVLSYEEIVNKYGEKSLFTSALIEVGLEAFDGDLWNACNTALGFGEKLNESHTHLLKRDFVRRFEKFSINFKDKEECAKCLKDVYYLHKWWKIEKNIKNINWSLDLGEKKYVDIDTMGAQACSGGQCEI
jgi:ribonucleoside-diphosphate reductase alpha chain